MHYCPYCFSQVEPEARCGSCGADHRGYVPGPHHLPPGTVLAGRYLLGIALGEGGFGITYLAADLRMGVKVAVKEYFPLDKATRQAQDTITGIGFAGAAAFREGKSRFLEEARTLSRIAGLPHIIHVLNCFESNGTAYIVMEYVQGITLTQWVRQRGGKVPAGELLPMMEGLFHALEQLHRLGLIHRDISPDNMMLENGRLRLLDFGAARDVGKRTETLTLTLRHGYAPVEQYQPMGQGPWTDVYALSATIYYCLTGVTPPHALQRICDDPLKKPSELGASLTHQQEQALLYGLGVRPRRRFQSVGAMAEKLYR